MKRRQTLLMVFVIALSGMAQAVGVRATRADATLAARAQPKRPVTVEYLFAIKDIGDLRISPDGTRVAYTVTSIDRAKNRYSSSLWIVPTQGGEPTELTGSGFSDSTPRWSPDGKKIAFASDRGGKLAIWVIDVGTREMRMITS